MVFKGLQRVATLRRSGRWCRDLTEASQGDCAIQAPLWWISAAVAPRRSCYVRLCVKSGRSVTSGHLLHGEFAHHELIDLAEGIAFEGHGIEELDQFDEDLVRNLLIVFWQRVGELRIAGLDLRHRLVERAA